MPYVPKYTRAPRPPLSSRVGGAFRRPQRLLRSCNRLHDRRSPAWALLLLRKRGDAVPPRSWRGGCVRPLPVPGHRGLRMPSILIATEEPALAEVLRAGQRGWLRGLGLHPRAARVGAFGVGRSLLSSGNVTCIVVPPPGVSSAAIVPPCARTSSRAIARPRPDPRDDSDFTKRSKTCSRNAGSMPG